MSETLVKFSTEKANLDRVTTEARKATFGEQTLTEFDNFEPSFRKDIVPSRWIHLPTLEILG